MAQSASEALKKEKRVRADDCWLDEEWSKNNLNVEGQYGYKYGKKKN